MSQLETITQQESATLSTRGVDVYHAATASLSGPTFNNSNPLPMNYGVNTINPVVPANNSLNPASPQTQVMPTEIWTPGMVAPRTYGMDEETKLQERFDYSGHDNSEPHLNIDLINQRNEYASGMLNDKKDDDHNDHMIPLFPDL